jgi:hypothetical protein
MFGIGFFFGGCQLDPLWLSEIFQKRNQQVTTKPPIPIPKHIKSHLHIKEENCVANCAYIRRLQKTIVAFNTWVISKLTISIIWIYFEK